MKKYDLVLLTDHRYEQPTATNDYIANILKEDELLGNALEKRGIRYLRKDWADPNFDWNSTKAVIFRTTWDYFHRFGEFDKWLDKVSQQTKVINPMEQIRWNLDKHYLLDLQKQGVRIPATVFIEKGEQISLRELHQKTGWKKTVLKPAISGAARHTYRLNEESIVEHEIIFQQLISQEAMLLQEFQENVILNGEVAFMFVDGKCTHAILKSPKLGDFRVQDDFGGTIHDFAPSRKEIDFAEKAIAACQPTPIYGRVDVIWDNDNQLAVSELELIEPELWFRHYPPAAELLADALAKELT